MGISAEEVCTGISCTSAATESAMFLERAKPTYSWRVVQVKMALLERLAVVTLWVG